MKFLYLLANHPGRVFSAEEIFERVWKEKYYQSNNTVMVHISKLRDKLEKAMGGEKIIHTIWGGGYKIEKKSSIYKLQFKYGIFSYSKYVSLLLNFNYS